MTNVAMVKFNNQYFDARVWCLWMAPNNIIAQRRPQLWDEFINQRDYNRLVCVKRANIMPLTEAGTICTFLPFFHAAALCFSGDELQRVLLIRHTATLNWLTRGLVLTRAYMEEIDVGKPPQTEPREFDGTLDAIYSFKDFRIDSKPFWGSRQLQEEARDFQRSIQRLSGPDEDFSGMITYRLNAHEIRLEIPYEAYMIYQDYHAITLVQNDRVAGI